MVFAVVGWLYLFNSFLPKPTYACLIYYKGEMMYLLALRHSPFVMSVILHKCLVVLICNVGGSISLHIV